MRSNGAILWRTLAGGWPYVNGLDLTPDGGWLAAGTKRLDTTVIRTSGTGGTAGNALVEGYEVP